ncbi:MAG: septum formation protein Maf [Thermoleophilia bacterium]|nr:septum formation protein Maf [Thermoleophilia bacterium]
MYLASKSPQRKAILESLGIEFVVFKPEYSEEGRPHELPAEAVERHSRGKAFSVVHKIDELPRDRPVLGVDTMVVFGGRTLGKASGEEEAFELLRRMSGRTHLVYSSITLVWAGLGPGAREEQTAHAVTEVKFSHLTDHELEAYVATGEWRDRAGAYAIQGRAAAFVHEIRGDYTNVVGLPVSVLVELLKKKGQWPPAGWLRHAG